MFRNLAVLLALTLAPALSATAQTWPGALSIPVHGNWCGPGHGGDGGAWTPPPIDALDAACLRHDICTMQRGAANCGCDIGFMNDLRNTPWPNPGLQDKARAVYDAIALVPCRDPAGQSIKIRMSAEDWWRDVASGRAAPFDFLRRLGWLGLEGAQGRARGY